MNKHTFTETHLALSKSFDHRMRLNNQLKRTYCEFVQFYFWNLSTHLIISIGPLDTKACRR